MSRLPVVPTPSLPYLASWTAAGLDITATGANAPLLVGDISPGDDQGVLPVLACDNLGGTAIMYLALVDYSDKFNGLVVWYGQMAYTAASLRRMALDNSSGLYLMQPATACIDTRGIRGGASHRKWHLGLGAIATATQVVLLSIETPRIL